MRRLDAKGRLHFTKKAGIRLKRYLDEMKGVPLQDVWTDISPINSQAAERQSALGRRQAHLLHL
jgi:site-specific DNA-methyltransferase (adenine-specific)